MLFSTIAILLLPAVALAAPGPIAESKRAKLATRDEFCAIVSNDGPVKCRSGPSRSDGVVVVLEPGTVDDYSCFDYGDNVSGNDTWDYNADYGCFVSGYYTDNNCSSSTLPLCSF